MAINVFTASGRLGNDIDIRYTQNNKCIGSFSLPVESGWGDNKKTSWVTCKLLGERAAKLSQYLTKGSQVSVTGEFYLDEWEKDGVKHSRPIIVVNGIQLPPQQQDSQQQGWAQSQQMQQPQQIRQTQNQGQTQYNDVQMDFDDSEIPFAPFGLMYGKAWIHCV